VLIYLQLPPQIRTVVSDLLRSMFRLSFEKKASQAVKDASGIVAASAREMLFGTLKQMLSCALVYSLYAPRPLTSPLHIILVIDSNYAILLPLTTPNETSDYVTFSNLRDIFTKALDLTSEVATKHSAVSEEIEIKSLNWHNVSVRNARVHWEDIPSVGFWATVVTLTSTS
jgi:hypothetical protein